MSETIPVGWVKAIQQLGSTGALIAIAAYVVYRLTSGIPEKQDVIDVKQDVRDARTAITSHVTSTAVQDAKTTALLQAICRNTAKDEAQRAGCQ